MSNTPYQWHGKMVSRYRHRDDPVKTLDSSKRARPEYTDIESHEYGDREHVLDEKISVLAAFVRQAKHCVAYTGAGLSVSSGLGDYASHGEVSNQPRGSGPAALPNDGHKALAKLHKAGYLKAIINQNHDGLLQKAGFPQECVNEIHGSWFDPSNPGGNILRDDLYENLLHHEAKVDLCLALGTSLSGLNADRIAAKAMTMDPGLVICNLQCTQHDPNSSLRIFAPLDQVLTRLADRLKLTDLPPTPKQPQKLHVFLLPYDPITGELSKSKTCFLNMTVGARFKILRGSFAGSWGEVAGQHPHGHWVLKIHQKIDDDGSTIDITDEHLLGSWWIPSAQQGLVPFLPMVPLP